METRAAMETITMTGYHTQSVVAKMANTTVMNLLPIPIRKATDGQSLENITRMLPMATMVVIWIPVENTAKTMTWNTLRSGIKKMDGLPLKAKMMMTGNMRMKIK